MLTNKKNSGGTNIDEQIFRSEARNNSTGNVRDIEPSFLATGYSIGPGFFMITPEGVSLHLTDAHDTPRKCGQIGTDPDVGCWILLSPGSGDLLRFIAGELDKFNVGLSEQISCDRKE